MTCSNFICCGPHALDISFYPPCIFSGTSKLWRSSDLHLETDHDRWVTATKLKLEAMFRHCAQTCANKRQWFPKDINVIKDMCKHVVTIIRNELRLKMTTPKVRPQFPTGEKTIYIYICKKYIYIDENTSPESHSNYNNYTPADPPKQYYIYRIYWKSNLIKTNSNGYIEYIENRIESNE
jgi:hypothetical protein